MGSWCGPVVFVLIIRTRNNTLQFLFVHVVSIIVKVIMTIIIIIIIIITITTLIILITVIVIIFFPLCDSAFEEPKTGFSYKSRCPSIPAEQLSGQ